MSRKKSSNKHNNLMERENIKLSKHQERHGVYMERFMREKQRITKVGNTINILNSKFHNELSKRLVEYNCKEILTNKERNQVTISFNYIPAKSTEVLERGFTIGLYGTIKEELENTQQLLIYTTKSYNSYDKGDIMYIAEGFEELTGVSAMEYIKIVKESCDSITDAKVEEVNDSDFEIDEKAIELISEVIDKTVPESIVSTADDFATLENIDKDNNNTYPEIE